MKDDLRVKEVLLAHFCANRRRYSMRRKFKGAVIAVMAERRLLKLGNVRITERDSGLSANTLTKLESKFPSKDGDGQPHMKKVESLTSTELGDAARVKGACAPDRAKGWFSG